MGLRARWPTGWLNNKRQLKMVTAGLTFGTRSILLPRSLLARRLRVKPAMTLLTIVVDYSWINQ